MSESRYFILFCNGALRVLEIYQCDICPVIQWILDIATTGCGAEFCAVEHRIQEIFVGLVWPADVLLSRACKHAKVEVPSLLMNSAVVDWIPALPRVAFLTVPQFWYI